MAGYYYYSLAGTQTSSQHLCACDPMPFHACASAFIYLPSNVSVYASTFP